MGKSSTPKGIWKPTEAEQEALKGYQYKIGKIIDRVRLVAGGDSPGAYIFGKPGLSKTRSITSFLEESGIKPIYVNSKITAVGLFDAIEASPDGLLILDDVTTLFENKDAVNILLALLSAPINGNEARNVSYRKSCTIRRVAFTGGIIAISNLPMQGTNSQLRAALDSRFWTCEHNPTPEEVAAFILHLASTGLAGIKPKDCMEVARFVIDEHAKAGKSDLLNLRFFIERGLVAFAAHKKETISCDWRDILRDEVQVQRAAQYPTQVARPTIRTMKADNKQALIDIINSEPKTALAIKFAQQQLGISRATFFNHKKELEEAGLITTGKPVLKIAEGKVA